MTLLIVDDHPTNLRLLRAQLEAEDHVVFEAGDGVDALALLKRQPVDAVISDILMPRMDGYRLCHEIRAQERLKATPFIFYTATYTSPGDEKLALDVGGDKYLRKPAPMETIIGALREVTGVKAEPRPAAKQAMPEAELMKEYNEVLVNKLEEQNAELRRRTEDLEREITERERAQAMLACQTEVLELIANGAPLDRTLDTLLRRMEQHNTGDLCSVLLLDEDGVHVRHGAAPSLPEEFNRAVDGQPIGPAAGSCGTAAFRREAVIVGDIATDPLWQDYRELALRHGLRACWSTPIFDEQRRVLGTFAIYSPRPGTPSESQRASIDMATHLAAVAIARHREAAALRASEARLRSILDTMFVFVGLMDLDGRIVEVNQAPLAAAGLRRADVLGKAVPESFWFSHSPAVQEQVREALARAAQGQTAREDYLIRIVGGQSITIDCTFAPLRDASGRVTQIVGSAADITARKQTEAALRQSEERFSTAFRASPVGICLTTLDEGRFLDANDAFLQTIGFTREEVVGHTYAELNIYVEPGDREALVSPLRGGGRVSRHELRFRRKSGELGDSTRSLELVELGGEKFILTYFEDITERKEAEAEVLASREQLRALLARLHQAREEEGKRIAREIHDVLGHLLTGLKVELHGLEKGAASIGEAKLRAALTERIRSAGKLAGATVDTVKKIALELRPTVLDHLGLRAGLDCEAREFQARTGLPCRLSLPDTEPPLEADRAGSLFRIFQEVLTNITRHAVATEVRVRLASEGGRVILEVADNGCGITGAARAKPGSLGLLGMRERALMAGGELHLHGAPGQGTTVTVSLPAAPERGPAEQPA